MGTSRSWAVGACLAAIATASARADDMVLRWPQMVGLIQAGNHVGSGTGQVTGGGQPWSIQRGHATVNLATGRLEFQVRGLVLAGGNGVGTPDGITQVKGTLVCDTNGSAGGGNSVLVDTPAVTFDAQGDARFEGNIGPLPGVCSSEPDIAFLVRIVSPAAVANLWIANGAVLMR